MHEETREFFLKHLPAVLETDSMREALDSLFDLIEEKGYAPPHYDEYNDFGREAQRAYDDLYLSNISEEELAKVPRLPGYE